MHPAAADVLSATFYHKYVDPDGESPLDIGFFIYDSVKFSMAVYSGNPAAIQAAGADLAASTVGLFSPIPGTGVAIKAARAAKVAKTIGVTKGLTGLSRGQPK